MKKLVAITLSVMYSFSMLFGMTALVPVAVHAADNNKNDTSKNAKVTTYSYVAQPGDSYSKMARKAIQTYGANNKIKMSNAKIIAAETWMTQAANSPELTEGQKVDIKIDTVKSNVEKAQKLNAADEAKWAKYTEGVNFDTSSVGQAPKK